MGATASIGAISTNGLHFEPSSQYGILTHGGDDCVKNHDYPGVICQGIK